MCKTNFSGHNNIGGAKTPGGEHCPRMPARGYRPCNVLIISIDMYVRKQDCMHEFATCCILKWLIKLEDAIFVKRNVTQLLS